MAFTEDDRIGANSSASRATALPPVVMLIAEHLDAILAAGEDLEAMAFDLTGLSHPSVNRDEPVNQGSLTAFIGRVRMFEGTLLLRLQRARAAGERLAREDVRFAPVARLFLAGLTELDAALATIAAECAHRADSALCPLAFMRQRGLVSEECGAFTGLLSLELDDNYLVAGAIPLGVVMDQTATFLDVLDRHYVLFPEPDNGVADRVGTDAASNSETDVALGSTAAPEPHRASSIVNA